MDMLIMAREKLRLHLLLRLRLLLMVTLMLTLMLMPGGVTTDTPMVATMAMDTIPMDTTGEESNHKKNNFTTMIAP